MRAGPTTSGARSTVLRDAGFDNISLDLIYGIPGQSARRPRRRPRRGARARARAPLLLRARGEARHALHPRPRRRSSRARPRRWSPTSSVSSRPLTERRLPLVRDGELLPRAGDRADLRSRHNLAYWLGRDYLGLGIGAVSHGRRARRWRNTPGLARYLAALRGGRAPPRELEPLSTTRSSSANGVMLGLRLDEPLVLGGLEPVRSTAAARPARTPRSCVASGAADACAHAAGPLSRRRCHRDCSLEAQLKFLQMAADRRSRISVSASGESSRSWSRSTSRPASPSARSTSSSAGLQRFAVDGPQRARRARGLGGCSRIRTRRPGRVPTEQGYRFYADELLERQEPRPGVFPLDLSELRRRDRLGARRRRPRPLACDAVCSRSSRRRRSRPTTVRHVEVLLLNPRP